LINIRANYMLWWIHFTKQRHESTGLMDSTVLIEALVNRETYPNKFNFS